MSVCYVAIVRAIRVLSLFALGALPILKWMLGDAIIAGGTGNAMHAVSW